MGLPKSGTTFLQAMLVAHKEQLAQAGLLFPGENGWKDHVRAVRDVRQFKLRSRRTRREVPGAWDRLARQMREWPGDSILSMEWLCRAEPEQVQRILRDLAPARVEVVFTLRDLGRTIPASWQESIQNRDQWTWPEFWAQIADDDPEIARPDRRFWRLHDAVALLGRWTPYVPADRIHVITVPRAGAPPGLLWERFCGVLGVDPIRFPATQPARNESLGVVSTEMLRRVNSRTRAAGISSETHQSLIAHQLAKRGLSRRRGQEPSLTIPADRRAWVRERAEEEIAGIRAAGVAVVGDLDELRPDLSVGVGIQPEDLDATVLLDAALDAVALAVRQRAEAAGRAAARTRRLDREVRRLRRQRAAAAARVRRWKTQPLRSALRHHVGRVPLARRVVRGLRRRGVS